MSKKWVDVSKVGEIASRGKSYTDSLVGSLSTITQNAISELDETKQEKFDGAPGMLAAFDDTGDPTSIPLWSNENLLRNADFRYPENQNGMETYVVNSTSEPIPCLKDWWLIGHGSLVVEDGYIRLVPSSSGSYVTMYQDVPLSKPLHIIGNPVTVSMFGTGPMAASFAGYDPSDAWESVLGWSSLIAPANSSLTDSEKLHTRTYYDFDGLNHEYFLRVRFSAMLTNGEARYTAVKLERGSIGTLAYRKATGDWMLNTVMPSYAETPDNLIVTGEPGKMAVYDENGELSSFSGNAGDLVTLDQNGNPVGKSVDSVIPATAVHINKNMVPNWNFQNIVNSAGRTDYPATGLYPSLCMDGWSRLNGSVHFNNQRTVGYVLNTKTNAATAVTVVQTAELWVGSSGGGQMTLSFLVGSVVSGSVRASVVFSNGSKFSTPVADSSEWSLFQTLLTVTFANPGGSATVLIEHKDGTDLRFTPYAIKLEEGSKSTLAYRTTPTSGNWQLYEHYVNETSAWTDANGRVPVGKNLLVNGDFEHLYNPLGVTEFMYGQAPIGWEFDLIGAVYISLEANRVTANVLHASLGSNATNDLLHQIVHVPLKAGDVYTASIELQANSVTNPNCKIYIGDTNIASISPNSYVDNFGQVTFVVPDSVTRFTRPIRFIIAANPSSSEYDYRIKSVKLEFGPVETLRREIDRMEPPAFISMFPRIINDNLLVNADFGNFINESGKTSFAFTGSQITNCCWTQWGNGTVTYTGGVATWKWTSAGAFFGQRIYLPQSTVVDGVFSVVYATQTSDATGSSGLKLRVYDETKNMGWTSTFVLPATGGKWALATMKFQNSVLAGDLLEFGVITQSPQDVGQPITREYIRNDVTTNFLAMKVETGNISTLADFNSKYNDLDLYGTGFDPVTELARVRNRERYINRSAFLGIGLKLTETIWRMTLPFEMRATPAVSNFESIGAYSLTTHPEGCEIINGIPNICLNLIMGESSNSLYSGLPFYTTSSTNLLSFDANP